MSIRGFIKETFSMENMLSRIFLKKTTPLTYYLNVGDNPFILPALFTILPERGKIVDGIRNMLLHNTARPNKQVMAKKGILGDLVGKLLKVESLSPILRQFVNVTISPGKYQYYSIDSFGERTRTMKSFRLGENIQAPDISNLLLSGIGIENMFEEIYPQGYYSSPSWEKQGIDPTNYIVPSGGLKEWYGESTSALRKIEESRPFSRTEALLSRKMPDPISVYGKPRPTFEKRNDPINIYYPKNEDKDYRDKMDSFDIIPFYIKDLRTGLTHRFRAMIEEVSPKFQVEWGKKQFLGVIQKNYPTYDGYDLSYTIKFAIVSNTRFELEHVWRKINELHWLCLPTNVDGKLLAPALELTLGDLIKKERGVISSLSIDELVSWEINAERIPGDSKFDISKVPMHAKITMEFMSVMPARYYGYPVYPTKLTQYIHDSMFTSKEESPYFEKTPDKSKDLANLFSIAKKYNSESKSDQLNEYIESIKTQLKG